MATLRDRHAARIDRLKALVFLIHFVGDLHQPLHAGEKGDAGGNKVNAAYGIYAPPRINLHSVWDGLLAERAISTPPSVVRPYSAAGKARKHDGGGNAARRATAKAAGNSGYSRALAQR